MVSTAIAASRYNGLSGPLYLESCGEGGQDLCNIFNGNYAVYNNINLNNATAFSTRVASATAGGNIVIHLDSPTGSVIGTCVVPPTNGWQTYASQTCSITPTTGTHSIYLVFVQGGFNLEWFAFN